MANHILFVDDDPFIREVALRVLGDAGYVVTAASRGTEAHAAVAESEYDLVITDLLMPDEDGMEIIRWLTKLPDPPPVIAISGGGSLNSMNYLDIAIKLGAKATLQKPFSLQELLLLVEEVLGS